MLHCVLTPSAGKRLIAKAVTHVVSKSTALNSGTIVVVAGTTNGYVAEEVLGSLGQSEGFHRNRFFRGITVPPGIATTETGRLPDESQFPGDVVIENGTWKKGRTIFDVVDGLKSGDIIVKGANSVDLLNNKAAILIGHPRGGTILAALQAVVGRRVRLLLPVGMEKRVSGDIDAVAALLNSPLGAGPRLLPVTGEIITELEAIRLLSGSRATLVAGGGVCGAEGAVWVGIDGEKQNVEKAGELLDSVACEPPFSLKLSP